MKKTIAVIILSFSLLVFGSCGGDRRVDAVLNDADTLMFSRPDSAVAMLDNLDLGSASDFQRARHALLLIKSREKAYQPIDRADSLISLAVNEFRGRGDSLETQALFYRGVMLNNCHDYPAALISLKEAVDRAADLGDDFYRAMAYREQADIYSMIYSELPRYECADSATKYFLLAGKPLHALYERINVAEALILLERPAEAIDSLIKVKDDAIAAGKNYAAFIHRKLSDACSRLGSPREAIAHLDTVEIYAGRLSSIDWSKKARLAVRIGDSESAEAYLLNAVEHAVTHNDSANIAFVMPDLYYLQHRYKDAYDQIKDFYNDEISHYNSLLSHPYTTFVGNYYKRESVIHSAKYAEAHRHEVMWVIVAVLLFFSVVCLILLFRHHIQLRQERLDILNSDMMEIQRQLAEQIATPPVETGHLTSFGKTSAPHHEVFNRLCELVSRYPLSDEGHKSIGFNVSLLIKSFQTDAVKRELENFVNTTASNLMQRFRDQFPAMSDKKLDFVLLIFAGFKNQSIYIMLSFPSLGAVRTMRHRVRAEIESSSCRNRDEFLSYFC